MSNKIKNLFNYAGGKGKIEVTFDNAAPLDPVEILIYEDIGYDSWTGDGITAKDIKAAVDSVTPRGRDLNFRISSLGGDVFQGMAIRSLLDDYPGRIIATIDGMAASTASWMIPADEVRAKNSSQMFIHDAWGVCMGNAEEMQKSASQLDTTSGQIAQFYADKTGKSVKSMRDLMKSETLLTGKAAKDLGLVDVLIEGDAVNNFSAVQMNSMKQQLQALNSLKDSASTAGKKTNEQEKEMNKEQKIALLNKWGVVIPKDVTDEWLDNAIDKGKPVAAPAKVEPAPDDGLKNQLATMQAQIDKLKLTENAAKRNAVEAEITLLINNDQLTENERKDAIDLAMGADGEKYMNSLKSRPSIRPGTDPLKFSTVEITGDSLNDITIGFNKMDSFKNQFFRAGAETLNKLGDVEKGRALVQIGNHAKELGRIVRKNKAAIISQWNSNTIAAGLQRQVILQTMLEEFAIILLPLQNFSTVFSNIPLEGTDKVEVPFYPLQTAASNSWDPAVGYNTSANSNVEAREIQIGGSGLTSGSSAPTGYAKDRKYLQLTFSSYELRRQPWVSWEKLARQNANKLAVDIFKDIISRVITAANYGPTVVGVPPNQFDATSIAYLCEVATGLNWPAMSRSLVLNHTYRTPLLNDPTFKQYLSYGSTDPVRKAIIQEAYGFENINIVPNLVNYSPTSENLVGWINYMYAMLVATAPIMPTEEVRALMTTYDLATDPNSGLTLEYRKFGNTTLDQTNEVVECSYGAAKGVASGLARITSQ